MSTEIDGNPRLEMGLFTLFSILCFSGIFETMVRGKIRLSQWVSSRQVS